MQIVPMQFYPQEMGEQNEIQPQEQNQLALINNYFQNPEIPTDQRIGTLGQVVYALAAGFREVNQNQQILQNRIIHLQAENEALQLERDNETVEKLRTEYIESFDAEACYGLGGTLGLVGSIFAGAVMGLNSNTESLVLTGMTGGIHLAKKIARYCNHRKLANYEQEYMNEHPNGTRREAFEYAKQKIRGHISDIEEVDSDPGYQPSDTDFSDSSSITFSM